ncbi:MAG: hypothetical protein KDD62_08115 [Bdellovibrionales bacterium]|nr:hypothetical protein [Bdellovibrionales bacterium]
MDPNSISPISNHPSPQPHPYPLRVREADNYTKPLSMYGAPAVPQSGPSWFSPNSIADRFFEGLDNIGAWWSQTNGQATDLVQGVTEHIGTPDGIYTGYAHHAARAISDSDGIGFDEALNRVPSAMKHGSWLSSALGTAGSAVDGVTGVLNLAETYHKEGYVGPQTTKSMFRSIAQTSLGALSSHAIGMGLASAGIGMASAPVIVGIAGGLVLSYSVGKFLDVISGES